MSQGSGRKLKLMVVDDERDNLDLLYRTFRKEFQVHRADSGIKALEVLEQQGEMAIIISDQRMPEMNGTEFLEKTVEQFPDTIRILLTGYTDVEDLVDAINAGKVFKYIVKPWTPTDLKAVVEQAAETYKVIKKRTNELRRSLRRESLMNGVMSAIRESLDYGSMLQTIVETIGSNFDASYAQLRPVEENNLTQEDFSYQAPDEEANPNQNSTSLSNDLVQEVLETGQTKVRDSQDEKNPYQQLIVPLTYQKDVLAILSLCQYGDFSDRPQADRSPWEKEDIQLIENLVGQAALALSQAKLYQRATELAQQLRLELEVARKVQMGLLRQSWPEIGSVKVQACCYPAREVGGDFFEVYVQPQGDLWVAVGDVSGKGVPAALFMASAISVLRRELSQEGSLEPDVVMGNLNSSLIEDLASNNRFITMALARYRPSTGDLVYTSAGHVYPIVWSHKTVIEQLASPKGKVTIEPNLLKARGIPVGILPVWKGKAGQVQLHPGDVLLLISDGITEAKDPEHLDDGRMLNEDGLWRLLTKQDGPLSLTTLLDNIRADNTIQEDDQTILSLEVL
ncbi:MAG: SpoIIE family protein phosphatase [Hormoscilla sp. SP5CHS1]|nr:SpoIIE family protein phosphatase [Hormoscilla sp. SP12CHS1]MBC6455785.1 SpoIIE family protein phosphatase [Hormoscilla sp. SP5CHS1]